jgi:hypothetical protein
MADDRMTAHIAAYQELCNSYHAIADFRARLLGLLPLASGAGIYVLVDDVLLQPTQGHIASAYLVPLGLFGFIVTLGLFFYELRGIQRCNALVRAGKQLESALGLDGQFRLRPPDIAGFIGSTLAARLIYPAVLAAWMFVAASGAWPRAAITIAIIVALVGCIGSFALDLKGEC